MSTGCERCGPIGYGVTTLPLTARCRCGHERAVHGADVWACRQSACECVRVLLP